MSLGTVQPEYVQDALRLCPEGMYEHVRPYFARLVADYDSDETCGHLSQHHIAGNTQIEPWATWRKPCGYHGVNCTCPEYKGRGGDFLCTRVIQRRKSPDKYEVVRRALDIARDEQLGAYTSGSVLSQALFAALRHACPDRGW